MRIIYLRKRIKLGLIFLMLFCAPCLAGSIELLNSAKDAIENGSYEKAINILTEVLKQDPQNIELLYYRAVACSHMGDLHEATNTYVNPPQKPPRAEQLLRFNDIALKNKKYLDLAINDLSAAILIEDKYIDAYNYRAIMYYLIGEYEKALADVRKVKELGAQANPRFLGALLGALMREGKMSMEELLGENQ